MIFFLLLRRLLHRLPFLCYFLGFRSYPVVVVADAAAVRVQTVV